MQEITKYQRRLNSAKTTILTVAVLTIINTVLIAVNAGISFPFSAYVPQLVAAIFLELSVDYELTSLLFIGVALALVFSLIYLLLWVGARKKNAFITVALVFFSIDSAILLFDLISYFTASYLIDIAFHAWVMFDLIMGIIACKKLKNLPTPDAADQAAPVNGDEQNTNVFYTSAEQSDSTPIGLSENKGRVIIAAEYNGMNVEVRRSKGLTELIVDGKVYAERKGIIETEYTLEARVSGVTFTTTMTASSVMFLFADGQQIAKKFRLI